MKKVRRIVLMAAVAAVCASPALARPRAPLPETVYDGGVTSAETLGRGNTIASNRGTPASGSENPAALDQPSKDGSLYSTVLVDMRSKFSEDFEESTDPLRGRVVQYISVGAERGVIFFEPISRLRENQTVDANAGLSRDVEFAANAIGFAGADKWKNGSIGLSIAYLWSNLTLTDRSGGAITGVENARADGLRMNLGLRYPTGAAMWGLVVQNGPGFLWGKDFRRSQLPIRVRAGSTYRLTSGVLFSFEGERRFYREGGNPENFLYAGNETFVGKRIILRAGAYGTSLNRSEDRRTTLGATILAKNDTAVSYAFEAYEVGGQKVKRSIVSVNMPFVAASE